VAFCASVAAAKLRTCAACGAAKYCDAACAKADWPEHKPMCAVFADGNKAKKEGRPLPPPGYRPVGHKH
jgi:hypothetical protein